MALLLKAALYYEDGSFMDEVVSPMTVLAMLLQVTIIMASLSTEEAVQLVILYVSLFVGVLRIIKVHSHNYRLHVGLRTSVPSVAALSLSSSTKP